MFVPNRFCLSIVPLVFLCINLRCLKLRYLVYYGTFNRQQYSARGSFELKSDIEFMIQSDNIKIIEPFQED